MARRHDVRHLRQAVVEGSDGVYRSRSLLPEVVPMKSESQSVPATDPRCSARAAVATQRNGIRNAAPEPNAMPTANVPMTAKVSVDPMHATDRYRLVMPWADRV